MRNLFPFLALFRRYSFSISLGIILAIATLLGSILLLTLSGWFLSGTCLAGLAGFLGFNYMLPAGGVRGAAIIRTAARYAERLVSHNTTFKVLSLLRTYTFSKLLPLTPSKINQFKRAELLNRLVADVDTLDHLYIRLISPLFSGVIVIIVVTAVLYLFNPTLALTLGSIVFVLLLLLPWIFYRVSRPLGESITTLKSQYRQELHSYLQSFAELSLFNALNTTRQQLDKTEKSWLNAQQQQSTIEASAQATLVILTGLTLIVILWLAASDFALSEHRTYIALFAFASLSIFEVLVPIPSAFLHLRQVIASARRVNDVIDQTPDIIFPIEPKTVDSSTASIIFEQVSFQYNGQYSPTLNNISLTIKQGQHIAILGKTGCGKSTLLQLLTRAYDPQEGHILLNEQPLCDFDEQTLRELIGVVPQRNYLFSETLRANLRLAKPSATDDELKVVLEKVGLKHLLEDTGLNSWLGDGGRLLSGGELRRLGIARAILHSSPIILMDEPTEGLDIETEKQIFQLIKETCKQKTLLVVTHRLTDLDKFDHIYIMENGHIIEQGSHQALIQQKQRYWQYLVSAQLI